MTNGTSQGLFVVVAIVIFGLFVLMSYILFRDTLKPSLTAIFEDGVVQAKCEVGSNNLDKDCNPTFNDAYQVTGGLSLGLTNKNMPTATIKSYSIWKQSDQSPRTINVASVYSSLDIVDGAVLVGSLDDFGTSIKKEFVDMGFGSDLTRDIYLQINNQPEVFVGKATGSNSYWGTLRAKGLRLKIGETNTVKITFINKYGGKSVFETKVTVINQ